MGGVERLGDDELRESPSANLLARIAQGLLGGGVDVDDTAAAVHREDAVESRLEDGADDLPVSRSFTAASDPAPWSPSAPR